MDVGGGVVGIAARFTLKKEMSARPKDKENTPKREKPTGGKHRLGWDLLIRL